MPESLRTISSKALMGFGAILALGIVLGALIVSSTVKSVSSAKESITVKGLAETSVKADKAVWRLGIVSKGATATEAYSNLQKDMDKVTAFLHEQKFTDQQISRDNKSAREIYSSVRNDKGEYREVFSHVEAYQTISVDTDDVQQMFAAAEQAYKLDEMGLRLAGGGSPEYLVKDLEKVKMSLIADATKNAHERASEFAKSGNIKVGTMKSASQGAFYILAAQGGTDDSDYGGVYDKTTIDKIARVVVTINYSITQ